MTRQPGIKRVAPGTYHIRATVTCPRTGRRKESERTIYDSELDDAIAERLEMKRELLDAGPAKRRQRLRDYATAWFERRSDSWAYSTRLRNAEHLDTILDGLGDYYLDALLPADVEDWLAALAKRQGAHSCRGALRVLRQLTKKAKADLQLPYWACEGVEPPLAIPQYTDEEPNLLTADELRRVMEAFRRRPRLRGWYPIALTMAATGARFAEAAALTWEDVDESAGVIHLRRSVYRGVVRARTKTGKRRRAALVPELAEVLKAHRQELVRRQHKGLEGGWVFPGRHGGPRATGSLNKPMHLAAAAAGVTHRVTAHGLRRTFIDLVRQVEADQVVIRAITGHATEEMHEHYSHVSMGERARAQGAVIRLMRGDGDVGDRVGVEDREGAQAGETSPDLSEPSAVS